MKSFSLKLSAVAHLLIAFPFLACAEPAFPKGAQVRLTKDAPPLFKGHEARTGKARDVFPVLQNDDAAPPHICKSTSQRTDNN